MSSGLMLRLCGRWNDARIVRQLTVKSRSFTPVGYSTNARENNSSGRALLLKAGSYALLAMGSYAFIVNYSHIFFPNYQTQVKNLPGYYYFYNLKGFEDLKREFASLPYKVLNFGNKWSSHDDRAVSEATEASSHRQIPQLPAQVSVVIGPPSSALSESAVRHGSESRASDSMHELAQPALESIQPTGDSNSPGSASQELLSNLSQFIAIISSSPKISLQETDLNDGLTQNSLDFNSKLESWILELEHLKAVDPSSEKWTAVVSSLLSFWTQINQNSAQAVQEALKTKAEAAKKHYETQLQSVRESATLQFRAELEKLLSQKEELLTQIWNSELQQKLDVERQGRLSRLSELSSQFEDLSERLASQNSAHDYYKLLNNFHCSLLALDRTLLCRKDLLSDEKGLESASSSSDSIKDLVYGRWFQKTHALDRDFHSQLCQLYDLLTQIQDFGAKYKTDSSSVETLESGTALLNATLRSHFGPRCGAVEPISSYYFLREEFERLEPMIRKTTFVSSYSPFVSHVISSILSSVLIFKKHGLVAGADTEAVLSRARYWLDRDDLDLALREVLLIKEHWPQLLLKDWIAKAQRSLEINQALKIMNNEIIFLRSKTFK